MSVKKTHFEGFQFSYLSNDLLAIHTIEQNKKWEEHISKFLKKYVEKYDVKTILDIGANFGYHTLFFSREIPEGMVYSFEPQIQNYKLLELNVNNNKIKNVKIFNKACGNKNEKILMPLIDLKNLTNNINMGDFTPNTTLPFCDRYINVDSVSVDELNIGKVDFVKIDVQGWEIKVLEGMINTIEKYRPVLIIEFENHQMKKVEKTCQDLYNFLKDIGYCIFFLDAEYPSDHVCVHYDNLEKFYENFGENICNHTENNYINDNFAMGVIEKIKL